VVEHLAAGLAAALLQKRCYQLQLVMVLLLLRVLQQ
jgi:hypothetical protein